MTFMALGAALLLDAGVGYPDPLYRKIGHPVTWIGWLIARLDTALNRPEWSFVARRVAGALALLVIVVIAAVVGIAIEAILPETLVAALIAGVIASALIAARSLHDHVRDVAVSLEVGGLDAGRTAVSKIVGREPAELDEHGVARAAIESLAENASDGVVAPVFWFAVLGLPGIMAYKAINTADSMIGHRSERYAAFGWAAAQVDDIVNLPASRLTGLLFATTAKRASKAAAYEAMWRDAWKHESPNAGWPESAMAGALGLHLGGPRTYDGRVVDGAAMGDGRRAATAEDIQRALRLAFRAWALMAGAVAVLAISVAIWRN